MQSIGNVNFGMLSMALNGRNLIQEKYAGFPKSENEYRPHDLDSEISIDGNFPMNN